MSNTHPSEPHSNVRTIERTFFTNLDDAILKSKLSLEQLKGIAEMLGLDIEHLNNASQLRDTIMKYLIASKHQYAPSKTQLAVGGTAMGMAYYFVSLIAWMLAIGTRYKHQGVYSQLDRIPFVNQFYSTEAEKERYESEIVRNLRADEHSDVPALIFLIRVGLTMFGSFVLLFRVFTSLFPSVRKTAKTKQMILEAINFANSNAVSEKMKYTKKKVQETCQGKSWSACGGKQCQYNYKNQTCHPSKEALARSMFVKEKRKK